MWVEVEYGKGEKLEFFGDSVEVFFFVFVDLGKYLGLMVGSVFNGKQMVESKVCA